MSNQIDDPADAMAFHDAAGARWVDSIAAIHSSLGYGHGALRKSFDAAALSRPASLLSGGELVGQLGHSLATSFASCELTASADHANEMALRVARTCFGPDRYRVITLLGSEHGDTHLLRSAGGRPERQSVGGPVVAGFRHVVAGELAPLKKAIDGQTAAVMLAPVDWNRGGEPFDADYLNGVQTLCRENDLLLIIDETRIPPMIGGQLLFHQRGELTPDLVTLSAGCFGGLSGGAVMLSPHASRLWSAVDSGAPVGYASASSPISNHYQSLLQSVWRATFEQLDAPNLANAVGETADAWSAMLNDLTGGFDFVRSCVQAGLWTTLELDLPAADVAAQAAKEHLRLVATSETHLLFCPPASAGDEHLNALLSPLRRAFEAIESETSST